MTGLDWGALIALAVLTALLLLDRRRMQAERAAVAAVDYTTDPLDTFEREEAEYIGPGQPAVALTLLDPPPAGELSDGADADLGLFGAENRILPRAGDAAAPATLNLLAGDDEGLESLPLSSDLRWSVVILALLATLAPFILRLLAS